MRCFVMIMTIGDLRTDARDPLSRDSVPLDRARAAGLGLAAL
jgi:hypothetical protein